MLNEIYLLLFSDVWKSVMVVTKRFSEVRKQVSWYIVILRPDISMNFLEGNFLFWWWCHNESALVLVIFLHQTGDEPLLEPVMTQLIYTYAPPGPNEPRIHMGTWHHIDCFRFLFAQYLADTLCFIVPYRASGICIEIIQKLYRNRRNHPIMRELLGNPASIYRSTNHKHWQKHF